LLQAWLLPAKRKAGAMPEVPKGRGFAGLVGSIYFWDSFLVVGFLEKPAKEIQKMINPNPAPSNPTFRLLTETHNWLGIACGTRSRKSPKLPQRKQKKPESAIARRIHVGLKQPWA